VIASIQNPQYKEAPRPYIQYTIERALWERLGWTYRDIYTRPQKQVNDYVDIIRLEIAEEAATMERQRKRAAAGK
jgi:hypothetical protein